MTSFTLFHNNLDDKEVKSEEEVSIVSYISIIVVFDN